MAEDIPISTTKTPEHYRWKIFKKRMSRFLYVFFFLLVLIMGALIYWKYFFTYSDGYRAGLLQKFSRKGNIFKTYEGEMILSSIQSNKNVPLASEKFIFSVADQQIAQRLDSLQGKLVVVHYLQKNGKLPWRGDTEFLVTEVRLGD